MTALCTIVGTKSLEPSDDIEMPRDVDDGAAVDSNYMMLIMVIAIIFSL